MQSLENMKQETVRADIAYSRALVATAIALLLRATHVGEGTACWIRTKLWYVG